MARSTLIEVQDYKDPGPGVDTFITAMAIAPKMYNLWKFEPKISSQFTWCYILRPKYLYGGPSLLDQNTLTQHINHGIYGIYI